MTIAKSAVNRAVVDVGSPTICGLSLVFILSDVRVTREGLALLLARDGSVAIVGTGGGNVGASRIAELRPDVVLLDAALDDMPGCAQRLREAAIGIRIVAFALGEVDQEIIACAEAGVSGFVGRDGSHQDLLQAIEQARRGEFSVSPRQATLLLGRIAELAEMRPQPAGTANLTRREREIVPLIERGLSNKEIARQLSIETATIKNHVHNILEKMRLRSRGEVAARARAGQAPSARLNQRP
jgi:two-component system, NarL family, nitrate/nitrite response regulator NarL